MASTKYNTKALFGWKKSSIQIYSFAIDSFNSCVMLRLLFVISNYEKQDESCLFFVEISFIHSFEYFQVVQLIAIYLLSTLFDLKSYIVNSLNLDEPNWRYSIHMAPPGDYLVEYIFDRRWVSSILLGRHIGRVEVLYCNIDLVHILGILMELGVSDKFLL